MKSPKKKNDAARYLRAVTKNLRKNCGNMVTFLLQQFYKKVLAGRDLLQIHCESSGAAYLLNVPGQGGTPIYELQELGGWESAEMVRRYAHLAPEHLAKAAARIMPVGTKMATVEKQKGAA